MDDEITDEEKITAAVRALEAADKPLQSRDWPALAESRLRQLVGHRLRGLGRQLLPVMDEIGATVEGYLSTWSDEAARALAGTLPGLQEDDLVFLALIYLHEEILGRVLGENLRPVMEQLNAYEGVSGRHPLRNEAYRKECLARLRARQLITPDNHLGAALKRLTPSQRTWLDQNLVLLLRPDHVWAEEIRQARQSEFPATEAS
ncbi:MAG: hypothetical protein ACRDOI_10035 [Trebonia sp.]